MIPSDHLHDIFLYFARFVATEYLEKNFKQPKDSRLPGYDEIVTELKALPQDRVIPQFKGFVFSINEKLVSDAVKNTPDTILFVEYGAMDLMHKNITSPFDTTLSITVASDFGIANGDGIQEYCLQNRNLGILNQILDKLDADGKMLEWCSGALLEGQVAITPIAPQTFYDKGGWNAIIKQQKQV